MRICKKIVTIFLALLFVFTLAQPAFIKTEAYSTGYPNTWVNTGNQIEDLIGVAMTQVGYKYSNGTKYGAWYGLTKSAWCGMFVAWCANQAGIPTSIIKKTARATLYAGSGEYHYKTNYIPKRGDLVLYNPTSGGYYFPSKNADGKYSISSHVAIVCSYDAATGKIWVVHGNATNSSVCYNSVSVSSNAIQAFVTPPYTTGNAGSTVQYDYVNDVSNLREGPSTSYDKIGLLSYGTSVEILETVVNDAGETWYHIKVLSTGVKGYILGELVTVVDKDTNNEQPEPEPKPEPEPEPDVQPTTYDYINGDYVRLRSSPTTLVKDNILGKYNTGTQVTITDTTYDNEGNKWYYVTINSSGKKGYVFAEYVTVVSGYTEQKREYDYANCNLNIRIGPGTEFEKKDLLMKNTKVEIYEVTYDSNGEEWYYVNVVDTSVKGFVKAEFITLTDKYDNDVIIREDSAIRETVGGAVMAKLKKMTAVQIVNIAFDSSGDIWYKVKATDGSKSYVGYIEASVVVADFSSRKEPTFKSELVRPKDSDTFTAKDNLVISGWAFSDLGEADYYYSVDGGEKRPFDIEKRTDIKNAYSSCTTEDCGFTKTIDVTSLTVGEHSLNVYVTSGAFVKLIHSVSFEVTDDEAPVGSEADVTDISKDGFTVTIKVQDDIAVDRVEFTVGIGNKEKTYSITEENGSVYTLKVKTSDLDNQSGVYSVKIKGFDTAGNSALLCQFQINPYTYKLPVITYDAAGGIGAPEKTYYSFFDKVVISEKQPTKEGKYFICWRDQNGNTYSCGKEYEITGEVTLVAKWSDTLPGDANGDNKVDILDLAVFKLDLSGKNAEKTTVDLNGDGQSNIMDLALLKLMLANTK